MNVKDAKLRCFNYRRHILDISQTVPALHIPSVFSCLEIIDLIYHELMKRDTGGNFLDVFVMSKGHAGIIQYVILKDFGILSEKDLSTYCKIDGALGVHPDYGVPGIAASTGSLGHGLGIAVGMAYAEKLKKSDVNIYVILSDGELQEGSVWEAIAMAANLKVSNLKVFLDLNDSTALERMSQAYPAFHPVIDKIKAFNWEVLEADGHDCEDIFNKISTSKSQKPFMMICNTVKGKGVPYMINSPIWHYRSPNKFEYEQALIELSSEAVL